MEPKTDSRWALAALLALSVAFRLPVLIDPAGLNSDGAVVALQARHFFQGGASWFLWGTNYQSSFDALADALAFALFGARPITLVCVSLAALLSMNALVFLTLRRHLGGILALAATLPLVFAPYALNEFIENGFRQWCVTCFAAAIFLLDGAGALSLAAGAAAGVVMLYLDLYSLQLAPAVLLFALLGPRRLWKLAGALAGAAFVLWVRRGVHGDTPTHLDLTHLPARLRLFYDTCGPWLVSARALAGSPLREWPAPWPVRIVQAIGPLLLIAGICLGGAAVFVRRVPWEVRRLGLLGFTAAACSVGGFFVSTMPYDAMAVRYLAPVIIAAPFALAPAAWMLGGRRFTLALSPYLAAAAIAGWLAYGDRIGPYGFPVHSGRGAAEEEMQLGAELRAMGIHAAAADYWLAYRLSLLWSEDPVVANIDGWERMPAYRAAVNRSPRQALLFHPSVPQTPPERYEARLRQIGIGYQRREIAGFTVLLFPR